MDIKFQHADGWLQVKVSFALPRGKFASATFRWGKMGPALGQIVAEWMNKALAQSIQAARMTSYNEGYRDSEQDRDRKLLHQDFLTY